MEDFYINNISQMESNNSNVTSDYDYSTYNTFVDEQHIFHVIRCIIISIGLPLTLLAIYSLYSQVQNNNVTPIFIINLLISDIIQFCYMIFEVASVTSSTSFTIYGIFDYSYYCGLLASVGFMVCIALERYLVIAWSLWYRFRRTIKISLVVCIVVWTLPLVFALIFYFGSYNGVLNTISTVLLLIPFPLLIFFLVGTLKALSAAISVPSDEKRRIVGMLVLVLLIYTLLFLPYILLQFEVESFNFSFQNLTLIFLKFSPLADLILYFFMRKGVIDKLLVSLCCCRMDSDDNIRLPV